MGASWIDHSPRHEPGSETHTRAHFEGGPPTIRHWHDLLIELHRIGVAAIQLPPTPEHDNTAAGDSWSDRIDGRAPIMAASPDAVQPDWLRRDSPVSQPAIAQRRDPGFRQPHLTEDHA